MMVLDEKEWNRFKQEIASEVIKQMLPHIPASQSENMGWLRGKEAKLRLGKISETTLKEFRTKGLLKHTKIMGTYYYSIEDIDEMMKKYKA